MTTKPAKPTTSKAVLKQMSESMSVGTMLQRYLRFLDAMHWHLSFTPDVQSFRLNAYKVAREALSAHGSTSGLTNVPGIGPGMRKHFTELEAGTVPEALLAISGNGPPFTVAELTRIPGVGPKTALKLHEAYGVASLAELEKKIKEHEVTDPKLIQGFYDMSAVNDRIPRQYILDEIESVLVGIRNITETFAHNLGEAKQSYRGRVIVAGSTRRLRPDIRDIDVLVEAPDKGTDAVIGAVIKTLRDVAPVNVNNKGGHKKAEIQIEIAGRKRKLDVNFLLPAQWGTAVLHFTGPSEYNVRVRKHALTHGMSVSQYGITVKGAKGKRDKFHNFKTEKAAIEFLGLPLLAPELRDHVKDIAKAPKGLVKHRHVFGDLHFHTTDSDGLLPTPDAIAAFSEFEGMRILGISNHSPHTGSGVKPEAKPELLPYRKQKPKAYGSKYVLVGAEVDILDDGSLDYSDKILKQLDYVVISIHHRLGFNVVERYCAAMEHVQKLGLPCIIAHVTGRIIGHRPGAEADYDTVFRKAAETSTAIEINGQWDRCDCPEDLAARAQKHGCYFALSSDFHGKHMSKDWVPLLHNAVDIARRAGVKRSKVINAHEGAFSAWMKLQLIL